MRTAAAGAGSQMGFWASPAVARKGLAIFGASTAVMSLQPLVVHVANERSAAEEKMGAEGFMLAAEAIKFALCGAVVLGRRASGLESRLWCGFRHTIAFAVPAAIYLVMNVLKVMAARAIAPPIFQLLASTKILATALASWALLNTHLTPMQWTAMLLLTAGVALGQMRGGAFVDAAREDVPSLPTAIMLFNSSLSAFGAVYTERVLKARQSAVLTIFATNLHMSAYSLLMNGTKGYFGEAAHWPRPGKLGLWTWAALFNEALNGILVSALMRHADSIVKNYAFGASILATAGLSVPLLHYWPQPSFFGGAVLVLISMCLYTRGAALKHHASNGNCVSSNGHGAKRD